MSLQQKLADHQRVFIVPLDHPASEETRQLNEMGIQNFVNQIDDLNHDGYIFHSATYLDQPVKTNKDFFLTVGEQPDNYLCDIAKIESNPTVKCCTIFFEVQDEDDEAAFNFYQDYVAALKKRQYFVMAMGFPPESQTECLYYQHIADIAHRLGCDAFKTDWSDQIPSLNLYGMKLFIGGGSFLPDNEFSQFVNQVAINAQANCSFGRNIFAATNYRDRINQVTAALGHNFKH